MKKYNGMRRAGDWVGKTARINREASNGWGTIPSGTIGEIVSQSNTGLTFESLKCRCCGARMTISRLPYDAVELLNPLR